MSVRRAPATFYEKSVERKKEDLVELYHAQIIDYVSYVKVIS